MLYRYTKSLPKQMLDAMPIICFIVASLLMAGCALYAGLFEWAPYTESRQYPKKPDFSILPSSESINNSTALSFSSIYSKVVTYADMESRQSYNFMRFWASGHVYKRVEGHLPSVKDAERFRSAYMGFYHVDGTNITIELFVRRVGYVKSKGYIDDDTIVIYEAERREGKPLKEYYSNNAYKRFPIDNMHREPDWSPTGMLHQTESVLKSRMINRDASP